ncbi:hypothetical protein CNMCM6106_008926 [Aspergillus hiratsukae]|uniref:Uncharacterized protein n=1 Tax=Aspergillus hiratsukae TaxID=1194566 RepID=A0A8H6UNX8_9EURO|nr:hypothetical protein CNMCM6106_008926 [Aspergillus hiratsukae]
MNHTLLLSPDIHLRPSHASLLPISSVSIQRPLLPRFNQKLIIFELHAIGAIKSKLVVHLQPSRPRSSEHYAWHRGQAQLAKNIRSHRRPAPSRDMLLAPPSPSRFKVLSTVYRFDNNDNLPVRTGPAG